jgi:hypothetical protein
MVLRLVHDSTAVLTLSMRATMALTKTEGEPQSWLLLTLADQEFACVRWPTGKGTRTASGAETSPLMMAQQTPRSLSSARVLLLESGHQRAKSASARVSKSPRAVAESAP